MFKLVLSLIILSISSLCLAQWDTLAQCQANCQPSNPCESTECLWYYAYYCNRNTITCDDVNACTIDQCSSNGTCIHTPVNCDDNDPCTYNYCHLSLGCISVTQDCDVVVPCNKTSDCYRGKKCETYKCVSGRCDYDPVVCPVELPCSEGSGTCYGYPTN